MDSQTVKDIMRYDDGKLSDKEVRSLFTRLIKSGIIKKMDKTYRTIAHALKVERHLNPERYFMCHYCQKWTLRSYKTKKYEGFYCQHCVGDCEIQFKVQKEMF